MEWGFYAEDWLIRYQCWRIGIGHGIGWVWARRSGDSWAATAWNESHILTIPEGYGQIDPQADMHFPMATNGAGSALQVNGRNIRIRPTANQTYTKNSTWVSGDFCW